MAQESHGTKNRQIYNNRTKGSKRSNESKYDQRINNRTINKKEKHKSDVKYLSRSITKSMHGTNVLKQSKYDKKEEHKSGNNKGILRSITRLILSTSVSNFNIDIIKELYAINVCAEPISNVIITCAKKYKDKNNSQEVMNNIIELVRHTILINAINAFDKYAIIELLIGLKSSIDGQKIIKSAILTKDPEIVRIICREPRIICDEQSLRELFKVAVSTLNSRIVYEMIIRGANNGYVSNEYVYYYCFWHWSDTDNMVDMFYKQINQVSIDQVQCDENIQILRLIMCSGGIVSEKLYKNIDAKKEKTTIDLMIMNCYKLHAIGMVQNNINNMVGRLGASQIRMGIKQSVYDCYVKMEDPMISKLINELKETMDDLIKNRNYKKKMIKEMEQIIRLVPSVCINIIYQYQESESKVQFIDWSKY